MWHTRCIQESSQPCQAPFVNAASNTRPKHGCAKAQAAKAQTTMDGSQSQQASRLEGKMVERHEVKMGTSRSNGHPSAASPQGPQPKHPAAAGRARTMVAWWSATARTMMMTWWWIARARTMKTWWWDLRAKTMTTWWSPRARQSIDTSSTKKCLSCGHEPNETLQFLQPRVWISSTGPS